MATVLIPHSFNDLDRTFGDPCVVEQAHGTYRGDPTWEHDNLVVLHGIAKTENSVQIHHLVALSFLESIQEAHRVCPDYVIEELGGYCPRHQRNDPKLPLSIHSWGVAVDINWKRNPMTSVARAVTDIPREFAECFQKRGWEWGALISLGGNWKTVNDPMHFQYAQGI